MKKSKKGFFIGALAVGGAIFLLGFNSFFGGGGGDSRVACVNPALPVNFHVHPELTIMVLGEKITVPENIGLSPVCHRVLHTHDTSGVIHVEANFKQDFTLGDFFSLWGKPLSPSQILDYIVDAEHELAMTVDGQPSQVFGELVFEDGQKIVLEYRKI